jgi:ABC-type Na+ efflux pump permease subunit
VSGSHSVYRSLLRLYPRSFRGHYGDDLVQQFADLVADRGVRAAWARTGVDLIVTVPRYRLESIMNDQHSATTLNVGIALLAAGGVLGVLTDLYPGLVLLVAALALAVAQRNTLARAIRTADSNRRRRRLRIAAVLALVCVASFVAYYRLIGDEWTARETVLTAIGTFAMVGAIIFLIVGLLTPRSLGRRRTAPVG